MKFKVGGSTSGGCVHCVRCQTELSGESPFCAHCGTPVHQAIGTGDTIQVGNITDSDGNAIGRGATALNVAPGAVGDGGTLLINIGAAHGSTGVLSPFMVEDLPADFVRRSIVQEAGISGLTRIEVSRGIKVALCGAGGFGKTTLAKAVAHDPRIRSAFPDGILWVTLGQRPDNIMGKLLDLIEVLDGDRPGFTGREAASTRLADVLGDRKFLIVVDDVWDAADLLPFLRGGERSARLMTTRREDVLPPATWIIAVDAMRPEEAIQMLGSGVPEGAGLELAALATRLGEWPLLLRLVSSHLRERVQRGQPLVAALARVNEDLQRRGLVAFDAKNSRERHLAVTVTLNASLDLLAVAERQRFAELAIFPEDVGVPLATVARLWNATASLDAGAAEDFCLHLTQLSLLMSCNLATQTIQLHDVVRSYIRLTVGLDQLGALHQTFLNSYDVHTWRDLPLNESYLWDWLGYHLHDAGLDEQLVATVKDLRYLVRKAHLRGAHAAETDLRLAHDLCPDDAPLGLLHRGFVNLAHLLTPKLTLNEKRAVVHARLQKDAALMPLCRELAPDLVPPYIVSWRSLPDLPDPALVRTLAGHASEVTDCAISPHGRLVVSGSWDQTLKVWDLATGTELRALIGHRNGVSACAISPDGRLVVSASYDQTLKVWDLATGRELRTLVGHANWVRACAISPDGRLLVSASSDQTLKVWDLATGTELRALIGHGHGVIGCAISPDGRLVVSASADHTLKVWDLVVGTELCTLVGHLDRVSACAISPDGRLVVSASYDQTLKVWDLAAGTELCTLVGHLARVSACAISPDGRLVVSASNDQTLKVWDLAAGTELRALVGHTDWESACAISPDGRLVVSASKDRTLKVWDLTTDRGPRAIVGHRNVVSACTISPDGRRVVSFSDDDTLKVFDLTSGTMLRALVGHTNVVSACAISPDGRLVVSGSWDDTVKVWNLSTGTELCAFVGHKSGVTACAISPDGRLVVSASFDRTLKVFDLTSGTELHALVGHTNAVSACAISLDGRLVVSASYDQTLKVFDLTSGTELHALVGHTNAVSACAISPDGRLVLSGSWDETLKVWDLATGTELYTLVGHLDRVHACAISPDGQLVLSVSDDETLKVWDLATGKKLSTMPFDGPMTDCAFHPDGQRIVAAGSAGLYWLRLIR